MARRMTRAFITGRPSSLMATARAAFMAPMAGRFLARAALGDGADGEHVDQRLAARALHDVAGHDVNTSNPNLWFISNGAICSFRTKNNFDRLRRY